MKKIIVGNGKVSQAMRKPGDVVVTRAELDLRDSVDKMVDALASHVGSERAAVVNCAAKINLEWCEDNKRECFVINSMGARDLARASRKLGLQFVQIGSGCVFDGMETSRVFTEDDAPTPASYYAESKAVADRMVLEEHDGALVIRPRQLVSRRPHPTNMLTKFLNLPQSAKFIDVPQSITCLEEMVTAVEFLIDKGTKGIVNVANPDYISPLVIARKLRKLKPEISVNSIRYDEYLKTLRVKRVNTMLSVAKLAVEGLVLRNAFDAVDWCINRYGEEAS